MALRIGQTIGQYRIVDQLGAGGMGVVYKAQDTRLGRLIALKVLPAGSADDREAMERFRREARTASSLNHSNICTIYNFEEIDGQLLLAMELLEGDTLARKLSGKPLDLNTLIEIGTQIGDALDAAHGEGILHRDIKPANIFVTRRGQVKVLDFGLAKLASTDRDGQTIDLSPPTEHFTSIAGTTVGTIAYMSPEQARGEDLDPRTDLFSFGLVLYEMATGRQSFSGATTAVVFDGILNREPAPPSTLNASVPAELDRIITKALEKDRTMRYQSAADVRADLQRLRRDSGTRRVAAASGINPVSGSVVLPGSSAIGSASAAMPAPSGSMPPPSGVPGFVVKPPSGAGMPSALTPDQRSAASSDAAASGLAQLGNMPASNASRAAITSQAAASTGRPAAGRSFSPLAVAAIAVLGVGLSLLAVAMIVNSPDEAPPVAQDASLAAPAAVPEPPPPPASADAAAPAVSPPAGPSSAPPAAPGGTTATTSKPPVANTASANVTPGGATAKPAPKGEKPAVPAPVPASAPPPATGRAEAESRERLDIARAKASSNLVDGAIADLRQIVADFPGTPAAADASSLTAELLEKAGRTNDAMGAYVEFAQRFPADPRAPASRLRLAELTLKAGRGDRELTARQILGDVVSAYPRTTHAQAALQMKLRLEQGKRQRERDSVLGIDVPIALPTLRAMTEQFPSAPTTMTAFNRLGEIYEDLEQFERAAQAYVDLATNFPNNPNDAWFRAGEIYERRLKDANRARDAYEKVPSTSSKYRDAQRKLNRK